MSTAFTDTERAILRIDPFQHPDPQTPYPDMAPYVGSHEVTVVILLRG